MNLYLSPKPRWRVYAAFLLFSSAFPFKKLQTQDVQVVSAFIVDTGSLSPVRFAHVRLHRSGTGAVADSMGFFQFFVPKGVSDSLVISCIGYETEWMDLASVPKLDTIYLHQNVHALEGIQITVSPTPPEELVKKALDNLKKQEGRGKIQALYRENYTSSDGDTADLVAVLEIAEDKPLSSGKCRAEDCTLLASSGYKALQKNKGNHAFKATFLLNEKKNILDRLIRHKGKNLIPSGVALRLKDVSMFNGRYLAHIVSEWNGFEIMKCDIFLDNYDFLQIERWMVFGNPNEPWQHAVDGMPKNLHYSHKITFDESGRVMQMGFELTGMDFNQNGEVVFQETVRALLETHKGPDLPASNGHAVAINPERSMWYHETKRDLPDVYIKDLPNPNIFTHP